MLIDTMHRFGLRSDYLHIGGLASIGLCLGLWARAKTMDQKERENAERRALFVGLWPPTFWVIGNALRDLE